MPSDSAEIFAKWALSANFAANTEARRSIRAALLLGRASALAPVVGRSGIGGGAVWRNACCRRASSRASSSAGYPRWGRFITQVGTSVATRGQLIDVYLTRDLELAQASGRLKFNSVRVARDLAFGASLYGIETMLTEPTLDSHPEQIVRCVLIGLGVGAVEAETIAFMPLEIPGVVERPIFSSLKPTKTKRQSGK